MIASFVLMLPFYAIGCENVKTTEKKSDKNIEIFSMMFKSGFR